MKIEELATHLPKPLPVSNHPDLIVFVIHDQSLEETRQELNDRLEKAQKIKHQTTRKKINDRLYRLKLYFDPPTAPDPVQHICFSLDDDEHNPYIFPLSKKQISLLRDFCLPEFIDYTSDTVPLDRLTTLFNTDNQTLIHSLHLQNFKLTYRILDQKKSKTLVSQTLSATNFKKDLETIVKSTTNPYTPVSKSKGPPVPPFYILHGSSTLLKKFSSETDPYLQLVKTSTYSPTDLLLFRHQELMKSVHHTLSQFISLLNHPTLGDKIIYGSLEREILEAVEQYRLKTLWVHEKVYHAFQGLIATRGLEEALNFQIIKVSTLTNGDIADTLHQNYGGVIGEAYY